MDYDSDHITLGAKIFELIDQAHRSDDPEELVKLHNNAYIISQGLPVHHELRGACAFNLGAAHIENQEYKKGLEYLEEATTLYGSEDDNHKGDLHFNKAIALYRLGEFLEAFDLLTRAIDDYQQSREDGYEDMIEECLQTMRQIICDTATRSTANQLEDAKRFKEILEKQNFHGGINEKEESRVWNELGLLNTQFHEYDEASECFHKAEKIVGIGNEEQLRAVILQNRGALCNFQGKYVKSIEFHEKALEIYKSGSIPKEKGIGVGQCHLNMAHAYSRWKGAGSQEAYKEFSAAKAVADKNNDKHILWQACEGLGAVLYNQGKYDDSVNNYRQANNFVFDTDNSERICEKLEKAILKVEEQKKDQEGKVQDTQTTKSSSVTRKTKRTSTSLKLYKSKTSPNI